MKIKDFFEPFIEHKIREGCAQHTINEYRRFIKETLFCLAEKKVSELRITDKALVMQHGRGHGYWGEQRAVSTFVNFIRYLNDSGQRVPFRWQDVMLPKVREKEQDFLTLEEFESFVSKINLDFYGLRDRVLYELLWSTGLRVGEALALNLEDIDFKEREIKVKTFKGGEGNKVYISDRLEYWLKRWIETRQDRNPALFVIYFGDIVRLKRSMSNKRLLEYRKEFGITMKLSHHAFRRGFCTYLLNSGANIKEVQYLARHRSERTTLKFYTKVTRGRVKEVHQNIFNNLGVKLNDVIPVSKDIDVASKDGILHKVLGFGRR
jgi:site-specific recombinase XerD